MRFETLTAAELNAIKRIMKRCEECGPKEPEELDVHRVSRNYNGGRYTLRNIYILCKGHHKERHAGERMGRKG